MDRRELQVRIDAQTWYHEFDFGGGLRSTSRSRGIGAHRKLWRFVEGQLDAIDFRGKTVLDIGCWDGYWSFYAERRGAHHVLATDDVSQNWCGDTGIFLARELLGSQVEVDRHVSVYELAGLGRTFDVILCLGVYYHLYDPFHAFAQVRHCCHPGTVVLFEGDAALSVRPREVLYDFADAARPAFLPSRSALNQMLQAAYFRVQSQTWMRPPWSLRSVLARLYRGRRASCRLFTACLPFEGANELHPYRPPFGLDRYDSRFASRAA